MKIEKIEANDDKRHEMVVCYPFSSRYLVILFGVTLFPVVLVATFYLLIGFGFPDLIRMDPLDAVALSFACAIVSMLICPVLGLLIVRSRLKDMFSFVIEDESLKFPIHFAPDLLFKRTRRWDDIGNVVLGSMLVFDKQGAYEYDLEAGDDNRKLFIHFKSGGHACVDLRRLSKDGAEKLFLALESSCLEFSRSPQMRIDNDDSRFIPQNGDQTVRIRAKSFTELWEQDLQDHFSATNYVPLKKGTLLQKSRYRVLMQISAGGMSAVYLAETPEKTLRIIKESVLPATLSDSTSKKAKELFTREAVILTKLKHPQIASVFDCFSEDGRDYLILDFIPGQSITQLIRQAGPQSEERVLDFARQIADILMYLHSQIPPVIHRDITPDNIVIREDGKIALIDFGAANEYLGAATGTMVGKQSYIAPEQFRGKATIASDLYAVGGSMFYMLTGRDPEPLTACHPREFKPQVSVAMDDLICRCMAQDAAERVATGVELLERIESFMENSGGVINITGREAEAR